MKKIIIILIILTIWDYSKVFAADYPQILTEYQNLTEYEQLSEYAMEITEVLLPENIFTYFFDSFIGIFDNNRKNVYLILALIMLSAVISVFKDNLSSAGSTHEFLILLAIVSVTLSILNPLFSYTAEYIQNYTQLMTSLSSGMMLLSVSGKGFGNASGLFIVSLTQSLCTYGIIPAAKAVCGLSLCSSFMQNGKLSGIISFIKSFCFWGLGAIFAVFGGIHSACVKISAGSDSLILRGVRFSAARLIPLAGNMISESLGSVCASINLLRSIAGGFGIAYLIYTAIPIFVTVISVKFSVLILLFISKIAGEQKQTSFFDGINAVINILLSILIFSTICGIIIFSSVMNSAVLI